MTSVTSRLQTEKEAAKRDKESRKVAVGAELKKESSDRANKTIEAAMKQKEARLAAKRENEIREAEEKGKKATEKNDADYS